MEFFMFELSFYFARNKDEIKLYLRKYPKQTEF